MTAVFIPTDWTGRPANFARVAELDTVALARPVAVDGRTMPAGSRGTVVAVYNAGVAYEIEFERPFHAVATVRAADLTG